MYKKDRYLNTDIHLYVQENDEYPRLLQHSSINPLSYLRDDNGKKPHVVINCSYFNNPYVDGRNQGDLYDATYNDQYNGKYCDVVLLKDGTYRAGKLNSWDYKGNTDVLAGFSPAVIMIKDGVLCELISDPIKDARKRLTTKSPQTALVILKDNRIVFVVSEGRNSNDAGLTGTELKNYLMTQFNDIGLLALLDGGGSSEMIIDGKVQNYLSDGEERLMLNGLAFIEEHKDNVQEDEQNIQEGEHMTTKVLDVSSYQPNIDYAQVKSAGIGGVILRCGRTYWGEIKVAGDDCFEKHYQGFSAVKLPIGVYYYSSANTIAKAKEEANYVLSVIKGKKLEYPIYFDVENNERQKPLSKQALTDITKAFCEVIENAGYYVGIYASKSWLENELDVNELKNYDIWVAQYNTKCTYAGSYGMWQYTSSGSVKGITGNVDLNYCYKDYPSIIKKAGLNHLTDETANLKAQLETAKKTIEAKDIEIIKLEEELDKANSKLSKIKELLT